MKTKSLGLVFLAVLWLSACSHQKDAANELGPFEDTDTSLENAYKAAHPSDPDFLREHLGKYGLKPLSTDASKQGTDTYRFLWTRSFHKPALFEISIDAAGNGSLVASTWEEEQGQWKWIQRKNYRILNRAPFRRWVDRGGFFELSFYDKRQGLDGAGWLIEISHDDRCHAVYRWSPQPGFILEFGRYLIESSLEKSDFLPIY